MIFIKPIKHLCFITIKKIKLLRNHPHKKRYILITKVLLILTIITSSYFLLINPPENRAYKNALTQIQNFQSAEFNLISAMRLDIKSLPDAQTNGDEISLNIKVKGLGKLDLPNKKMNVIINTAIFNQEISIQEIIVDGQVYLQSKTTDPYYKLSPDSIANMNTELFNFKNFQENQNWGDLSKESTAQYIGKDKIDDKQALRYEINLSKEDSDKSIQKILNNLSANLGEKINLSEKDITKAKVKIIVWVDKQTKLPLKEQTSVSQISFTLPNKAIYTLTDIITQVSYRQFNKPVQVTPPTNFRNLPVQ